MPAERRTYTHEDKAQALAAVTELGLAGAWRSTGIPKPTLAMWARAAGMQTDGATKTQAATLAASARADQLRAELRLRLLEQSLDLLERMDAPHIDFKGKDATAVTFPIAPAGAVQNYATSVGILIDKYRLEVGEATNRTESRELTDKPDDELQRLVRDADAIVAAGSERAAQAVAGPTEG